MITANLATIKSRESTLQQVVDSLKNQVDLVRIYGNDYKPSVNGSNVEVYTGPDYTDNAKFFWLPESKGIYLSCDDDLIYPGDYVERIKKGIRKYPGTWLTFHGRKLMGLNLKYYTDHSIYRCLGEVKGDYEIDVPGTGVSAFETKTIKFDPLKWNQKRMSDLMAAKELAMKKTRVICLGHESNWIKQLPSPDSIYHRERLSSYQNLECDRVYRIKYG